MKHGSPHHMPFRHQANSIDDMDALLNHIEGFTRQVLAQHNKPSQQLAEEWNLFKQYVQWKQADLVESSHLHPLPDRKPVKTNHNA
ncbi:MAG TPA: hypothetical protein VIQ81_03660 [Gammaproteobacteria bacterium]